MIDVHDLCDADRLLSRRLSLWSAELHGVDANLTLSFRSLTPGPPAYPVRSPGADLLSERHEHSMHVPLEVGEAESLGRRFVTRRTIAGDRHVGVCRETEDKVDEGRQAGS